jgi:hypothetical protein
MKKGPIGVWFSVALVIFGLATWAGVEGGSWFAGYLYRHKQHELEKSYTPERARVESELAQFRAIEVLQALASVIQSKRSAEKQYLVGEIEMLERQNHQPQGGDIRPAIELNLGLAYVEAAMAEEKDDNNEAATKYMRSAQAIFQSLGWKDYSEEALKTVAQRELDKGSGDSQVEHPEK